MEKRIIIVRHGNTFTADQTPTRVGAHTDLPLVEEHRARSVGRYLLDNSIVPDRLYAAPLLRTTQTAQLIADQMGLPNKIIPISDFTEIDYGADENQTEEVVEYRLGLEFLRSEGLNVVSPRELVRGYGKSIIDDWNNEAKVPKGWVVDVDKIIADWRRFANGVSDGESVLVSSSNGIIRFAPHILKQNYERFSELHDLKVATGSVSIFEYENDGWVCKLWGEKPYKFYE